MGIFVDSSNGLCQGYVWENIFEDRHQLISGVLSLSQ